jgi:hypothetical protein
LRAARMVAGCVFTPWSVIAWVWASGLSCAAAGVASATQRAAARAAAGAGVRGAVPECHLCLLCGTQCPKGSGHHRDGSVQFRKPYRWESQYSEVIIVAATNLTRTEQVMQSIRDRIDRRLLTPGASLPRCGRWPRRPAFRSRRWSRPMTGWPPMA